MGATVGWRLFYSFSCFLNFASHKYSLFKKIEMIFLRKEKYNPTVYLGVVEP